MNFRNLFAFVFVLFVTSCTKESEIDPKTETPETETPTLSKVVSGESENALYTVELFTENELSVGYNPLLLRIIDKATKDTLSNVTVQVKPMMHMTDMMHTAPSEQPTITANSDKYFEAAVVLIMPSSVEEYWSIDVTVGDGESIDKASIKLPIIKELEEPRLIRFISPVDNKTIFISRVEPNKPEVGINDFTLVAHYKESMMSFPPVNDLDISFTPEMPSMGHGSPNNVQPVFTENGYYTGKINFSMTGWWKVNLVVNQNSTLLADDKHFNITF